MTMMKSPRMWRDMLVVGFAMFAVFFGAGNLIFPPQVGFQTGADWEWGLLGLLVTGMLLPTFGVVAVGLRGGTLERLTRPIASWFGTLLLVVSMTLVAWLVTIPRTGAVAFETGLAQLVPAASDVAGKTAFLILYFAISLFFAIDRSSVIDKIGKYLTPALLVLLVGIVAWAFVAPVGEPVPSRQASPFHYGFITGYQTGDVLTGLLFGVIFIDAIRAKNQDNPRAFVPMLDRFDLRLDPAHAGWGAGEPGMTGSIAGWYRFADGREPDPIALLTICDVLPPVTFDLGMPGWAPTLELTVHVRAHPAPGWLKVRHATRTMAGGLFEEDCEVWDSAGRLVAQSRQLALLPRRMPGS